MYSQTSPQGKRVTFIGKPSTPLNTRKHHNLSESVSLFSKTWNLITSSFSAEPSIRSAVEGLPESSVSVPGYSQNSITKPKEPVEYFKEEEDKENLRGTNEEGTLRKVSASNSQEAEHKSALCVSPSNDHLSHEAENASTEGKSEARLKTTPCRSFLVTTGRNSEVGLSGEALDKLTNAEDDNVGSSRKQAAAAPRCAMEYMKMICAEEGGRLDKLPLHLTHETSKTGSSKDNYGGVPIMRESSERVSSTFLQKVNQQILKIKTDQANERLALINRGAPHTNTASGSFTDAAPAAVPPLQYCLSKNPAIRRLQGIPNEITIKNTPAPPSSQDTKEVEGTIDQFQASPSPERSRGCRPARSREICYPLNPEFTPEESADARRRAAMTQESCLRKLLSLETAKGVTAYSLQCAWAKAEEIFRNYVIPLDAREQEFEEVQDVENIDDRAAVSVMRLMGIPPGVRNTIYWEVLDELQTVHEFSMGTISTIGSVIEWLCTGKSEKSEEIMSQARYVATAQTEVDPDSDTWRQFESDLSVFTDAVVTNVGSMARAVTRQCAESSEQVVARISTAVWRDGTNSSIRFNGGSHRNFRSNLTRIRNTRPGDASRGPESTTHNIAEMINNYNPPSNTTVRIAIPPSVPMEINEEDWPRESRALIYDSNSEQRGDAEMFESSHEDMPVNTSVIAGMVSASEFDLQSSPSTSMVEPRALSRGSVPSKSKIPIPVKSSSRCTTAKSSLVSITESVTNDGGYSVRRIGNGGVLNDPSPRLSSSNSCTFKEEPPRTPSADAGPSNAVTPPTSFASTSLVNDVPPRAPSAKADPLKEETPRTPSVNYDPLEDLPPRTASSKVEDVPPRAPSAKADPLKEETPRTPSVNYDPLLDLPPIAPSANAGLLNDVAARTPPVEACPSNVTLTGAETTSLQKMASPVSKLQLQPERTASVIYVPEVKEDSVESMLSPEDQELFSACKRLTSKHFKNNSDISVSNFIRSESDQSAPSQNNNPLSHKSSASVRSIPMRSNKNNGSQKGDTVNSRTHSSIPVAAGSNASLNPQTTFIISAAPNCEGQSQSEVDVDSRAYIRREVIKGKSQVNENEALKAMELQYASDPAWQLFQYIKNQESGLALPPDSVKSATSGTSRSSAHVSASRVSKTLSATTDDTLVTPSSGTSVSNGNHPLLTSGSTIGTQNSMYYETSSGHAYFLNPDRADPIQMVPLERSRRSKMSTLIRTSRAPLIPQVPASSEFKLTRSGAEIQAKREMVHLNNIIHGIIKKKIVQVEKEKLGVLPKTSQKGLSSTPSSPATPLMSQIGQSSFKLSRTSLSTIQSPIRHTNGTGPTPTSRTPISTVQPREAHVTPSVLETGAKGCASKNSYLEKSKLRNQNKMRQQPSAPTPIMPNVCSTSISSPARIHRSAENAPDTPPSGRLGMLPTANSSASFRNPFPRLFNAAKARLSFTQAPPSETAQRTAHAGSLERRA